jgi:coproporphyrinogen III oxidase-like Fe-S oxidoreductase
MTEISNYQGRYPLPTNSWSQFFPLFEVSDEPTKQISRAHNINRIGPLALNIYCPGSSISQYENLLCEEMSQKRNYYDIGQPVSSFWFLGHPLRQLSPEGITELCFRFSNHLPHNSKFNTERGICLSLSELDNKVLALCAGLKFNCVELRIDASIASKDRSLSKIEAGLNVLADYSHINFNCKIICGSQSHPNFLMRLLSLILNNNCQQTEIVWTQPNRLYLAADSGVTNLVDQFAMILEFFTDRRWTVCGNNYFFAPGHKITELRQQKRLNITPWGIKDQLIQTHIGVGIDAISYHGDLYEHNSAVAELYSSAIADNNPSTHIKYYARSRDETLIKLVQDLVCYHRTQRDTQRFNDLFAHFLTKGWAYANNDQLVLSKQGILHLNKLTNMLFVESNRQNSTCK